MNTLSNAQERDPEFERLVSERIEAAGISSSWDIFACVSCDSTMELASGFLRDRRSRIDGSSEGVIPKGGVAFFSRTQTKGRGRSGRSWESREGGLYATFLLSGNHDSNKRLNHSIDGLSLAVGLAIIKTLQMHDVPASLKWPNDVLVMDKSGQGRKKISGILVDTVYRGDSLRAVCIGVGLNVNQRDFPSDLQSRSMAQVADSEFDLATVAGDVLLQLEKMWLRFCERGLEPLVPELNESHVFNGEVVLLEVPDSAGGFSGGTRKTLARVVGIMDDGSLLVENVETGERIVYLNARIHVTQDQALSVGSNHG